MENNKDNKDIKKLSLNIDIYGEILIEGKQLYGNLKKIDNSRFNNWCVENFSYYGYAETFKDVAPSNRRFEKFINLGYKHEYFACHYSAQSISLLDSSHKTITGFLITQCYYPLFTHSFNFYNNQIMDFSRFEKDEVFSDSNKDTLPHDYYGIELPVEFLKKYENEILGKTMNPLLYEFYKECNLF